MTKSFSKRLRLIVLALFSCILCAGLVLGAACSDNKNKGGVTLDRYEVIMYVGDVQDINASGEDKNGKEFSAFDYKWSYTGDDCITLELAGSGCRITAVSEGSATITVEAGNFSTKCDVVVKGVAVEKVTLDKDKLDLDVNAKAEDTITATAELNNKKTYDGEYEWKITGGENCIEISYDGAFCTVTAKSAGTAVITVTAGGKSANCTVTVTGEYEKTHTHSYEVTGAVWSSDYSSCDITLTCANTDGECEQLTVTETTSDIAVKDETSADCVSEGSTTYVATLTYGGVEFTAETTVTTPALGHTYPAPEDENIENLVIWDWGGRDTENKTVDVTVECTVCHEKTSNTVSYTESNDGKTLSAAVKVGNYDYSSTYNVDTGESEQSGHTHSYTANWEWDETDYSCKVTLTCSNDDGNCSDPTVSLDAEVTSVTTESTCTVAGYTTYTASVEYGGTKYTTEGNDEKVVELPLAAHTLVAVEEVDATCTEDGTEAYWKCSECGKLFSDESGEDEIESATAIPKTGHTYPETSETANIQWNWESRVGDETSGTVSVTLICTVCGNEIGTFETSYSVKSDDETLWYAEYSVDNKTYKSTYSISEESSEETSDAVIELDFTGNDFAEGTLLTEGGATGDVALKYANGIETGFTVKGSKSDYKSVTISSVELGKDSGEYRQALVFNGTATNEKNSLAYTLDAGTYKVVLSYFNTNMGRYATVLDASGNEYVALVAEEDKTDGTYDIFTREIYITLTSSSTIYIGSKSNGLYITYIGIFEADSEPEYTVTGVSLSNSEITLEVGKENEISAIVTLSDGKTYKEYDGTFAWTLEGTGVVSLPDTTKYSASFTGVAEGNETITVSINGHTASCAVTVVAAAEVTLVPIVEVDFTASGNFTSGTTILDANSGTTAPITYTDGTSTGLTAVGTDSGNTKIEIATANNTTILKTNGTGSTTKGSVSYTFTEAGTYSVVISYMHNNSTPRWGVVLDANGNELGDSVKESEKTDTNYTVKTRTVTFDAAAGDTIYIGSNNSGLYFTFIGIYKVEEASGDTGSGSGDTGSGDTGDTGEKNYEWVPAEFDIAAAIEKIGSGSGNKVASGGYNQGIFTVAEGAYFNSDNINTQGKDITIVFSGIENTLSFTAEGASGNNTLYVTLKKDGTDVTPTEWLSVALTNGSSAEFSVSGLEAGTYTLVTSTSAKIYNLKVEQYLEESDPESLTVTAGTIDFLLGRNISVGDLNLSITLNYKNGRQDPLTESNVTTDLENLTLKAGANTVTVTYTYTDKSSQAYEFTATVTIYLYEVENIEISDFSMAYTGGTYYTNNVQKIYLVGDAVSYAYAAVTATACYGSGSDKATATFILTSDEVSFKTTDSSGSEITGVFTTTGAYTVTATVNIALATDVTSSYTVNVVSADGADATQVKVDQSATTISMNSDGVYTVSTINDAIQLIKLLGASDDVRKYIYVGAGQYWEKIYIDIPNLTLIGENSSGADDIATRQDSTTGGTEIVYWAFNGLMDPSGTTSFSTVGSATVTVAKEAVGFCAANITFRNYWNTNALYKQCYDINTNTQADAAYINADKVYFYNVTFTGYHDTLEAENGRQYYDHCYIEGRTDYIFGNTATCYFSYCTIHTIGAGDSNNGGYVMAIKGTGVDYGYIFNYCNFTTDLESYYKDSNGDMTVPYEGFAYTVEGTVSVARTWSGSDMHIAILNSTFDNGFSKEAYVASTGKGESGKNSRYTHMTAGQAPTPEYLVEYKNTGDGAISGSLADTCTVYTNEYEVADYLDFTKIFAIQNGSVIYDDDWSGASVALVTVTVTADGNTYTVTGYKNSFTIADVITSIKSEDATVEITTLYDENGNAVNETAKVGADMTLTAETAEADMTVPSSVTYDFSGADTSIPQSVETGWLGYLYVDTGTSGEFKQNNDWYILTNDATITVRLSAGSSITFEMYENPSLAINGVTISTDNMDQSGSRYYYTYIVTSGVTEDVVISRSTSGSLYFKTITIDVPVIYQIGDYIDFTDASGISYQGSVDEYKSVQIDTTATNAKFAYDSAGCIQINTDTILCVPSVPGASAEVNFWGSYGGKYTVSTDKDGIITITFTELNDGKTYITGITITEDPDYEGPDGGADEPVEITGVTLDNSVITIGVGEEVVLSAIVEFSDGTTASGYTDAAYSWNFSVTGVVSQSGSGDNITLKGLQEGTVTVTVSVNGFTAQCVMYVSGTYSEELMTETYKYVFGNMGIDSIPTSSDSKTDSGKTYYFSETSWSESVIGNGVLSYTTHSDKINTSDSIVVNGVTYTGSIQPNGATQSSGNRSFRIDLSSYLGNSSSITIEVICAASAVEDKDSDGNGLGTYTTTQILISKSNTTTDPSNALAYTPVENLTSNSYTARDLIYSVNMDDFASGATDFYITFTQTSRVYAVIITVDGVSESRKIDYDEQKEVIFKTNSETIEDITSYVFNYSAVSAPILPNVTGKYFIGWYADASLTVAYDFSLPVTEDITLYAKWDTFDSEITYIQGAYESISIEFYESNLNSVKIYYKEEGASSYTTFTDVGAMRTMDEDTHLVRVDIVGLTGGRYYSVKVLTSANEELTDDGAAYSIYVASYDRSGYAHFNYDDGVGAYEDDGTLKDGALVIYVTEDNKNDVTDYVYKYDKKSDSYSKVEWTEISKYLLLTDSNDISSYDRCGDGYVRGIGEILNNSRYSSTGRKNVGIAALCDAYGGVVIRIVGEVTASLTSGETFWGYDDEEKTYRWMVRGSYDIIGLTDLNTTTNAGSEGDNGGLVRMRDAHNLTIEGVGEGAVVNGWGFSFIAATANIETSVKTGKSFEVRNLTFINYPEDAIGIEGSQYTPDKDSDGNVDKTGAYLTASAERIWIHNNTFYAGYCEYPAESDKSEGDGTVDFKRGQYFTLSYNYFEGCHKTDLIGADKNNMQFNISMHHNFWYNCQSRIPMTRNANIHYYNNYVLIDDTDSIQYVMSARADAYIYAEYNYFEGCINVFQATNTSDGNGTIKAYGNVLDKCTGDEEATFADSRSQYVENSCGYWYYGIDYSAFDTNPTLFYYDATKGRSDCYITSAVQAKTEVMQTAGAFSRDKVVTCSQFISAEDVVKPQSPYFDLTGDAPDETSLTYSEVVLAPCRKETF